MSSYIPRSLLDQAKPETSDPTYRMSMLPFATYPNADGSGEHLGFATPGMIQEPMNALMRLIGTPSQPGTFAYGPDVGIASDNPVRSQFPAQEDMRTLLESTFGGNATRGMGAVERGAVEAAPTVAGLRPGLTVTRDAPPSALGAVAPSPLAIERKIPSHKVGVPGGSLGFEPLDLPAWKEMQINPIDFFDAPLAPGEAMFMHPGGPNNFSSRYMNDAGDEFFADGAIEGKSALIESMGRSGDEGSLSRSDMRRWRDHLNTIYPDVEDFAGYRVSGARAANSATDRTQTIQSALLSDNLPSLPGAVIAGAEKQPFNPTDFRLADLAPGQSMHAAPYPHDPSQFLSRFNHGGNNYEASGHIEDGTAHVGWIGSTTAPFGSAANTLGRPALRQWRDSFLEQFPDVKAFSGERISGSRAKDDGEFPIQTVSALFSDQLPSLWSSALQGQQNQPYPNSLFGY